MTTDEQLLSHTATVSPVLFFFCILMTFLFSFYLALPLNSKSRLQPASLRSPLMFFSSLLITLRLFPNSQSFLLPIAPVIFDVLFSLFFPSWFFFPGSRSPHRMTDSGSRKSSTPPPLHPLGSDIMQFPKLALSL